MLCVSRSEDGFSACITNNFFLTLFGKVLPNNAMCLHFRCHVATSQGGKDKLMITCTQISDGVMPSEIVFFIFNALQPLLNAFFAFLGSSLPC